MTNTYEHKNNLSKLTKTSQEFLRLLVAMLSFNPMFRPNASQLLKSKIFDCLRNTKLEKGCPFKIEIDFDDNFE